MAIRAGFAQADITPPIGTHKIGWIIDIVCESVLDPLFARVGIIESGDARVAFVGLDTLCVRWTHASEMRRRIAAEHGFPGENIMFAASHNHAGGAVANVGDVHRDVEYVQAVTDKVVAAFGEAAGNLREVEIGCGSVPEWTLAFNRRVVMRDGTVCTHGRFDDPGALHLEGPIDPEVAVLAARTREGSPVGCIVNFACHPTHHGGGTAMSAGFPGVLAREMERRGWPVTVFLNGASGNLTVADPVKSGAQVGMEEAGQRLATAAEAALKGMTFQSNAPLRAATTRLYLPYRAVTDDEIGGTVRGPQRFCNETGVYDRRIPGLVRRISERNSQPAEVQLISIGEHDFVGIPAEYFVEHGLRIKEEAHPRHALVVSHANGMVGYVPTQQAFARGGYETTFAPWSRLAPEAGDMLADAAISLIKSGASGRGGPRGIPVRRACARRRRRRMRSRPAAVNRPPEGSLRQPATRVLRGRPGRRLQRHRSSCPASGWLLEAPRPPRQAAMPTRAASRRP